MIKVLFVCLGNICRSPMAEAIFQHKVALAGLENEIEADSAGTGDWHVGSPPHRGTQAILKEKGICCNHLARQISSDDFQEFDYLITMDSANSRAINRLGQGNANVRSLLSFVPNSEVDDVPDPYYTGDFDTVYKLIDNATDFLLAEIIKKIS